MREIHFVLLLLLASGCVLIQGKKEEKATNNVVNAVAKANTNILEIVQLFKSLLNQALSKADLSSVRGVLSSPLSLGATAISVLLGGIVLMAFYESPLSPLPVPPLPQAPVGRFPPENPIVAPMNGGRGGVHGGHGGHPMQRAYRDSGASTLPFLNPELFLREQHRRMLYQPMNQNQQTQQFVYQKNQATNDDYPTSSIKRSSNGGVVYSYLNQPAKNALKSSNHLDTNAYHLVENPLMNSAQDLVSLPSSVRVHHFNKDTVAKVENSTPNLQASASSGHAAFVAPPSQSNEKKINSNLNNLSANSKFNQPNNQMNNINVQSQASPVYRPVDEESRTNEKVSLDHYAIKDAIKEQDFDQKQLVHSQLSQIEFKTSPELAKLEESLKRSVE